MSFLDEITPVILTFNEEANIGRALAGLAWANDIVVVDSFSTDRTVELVRAIPRARVVQRVFDTHAQQWNFAIEATDVRTDWILALDADYVVPDALVAELRALQPGAQISGYAAKFRYCVMGRPLRGALYPEVTVLFRRDQGRYDQLGHTQRLSLGGTKAMLRAPLLHDDRKPLSRWFSAQQRYARLEAEHLLAMPRETMRRSDRIRALGFLAPPLVFLYVLIGKGCALDGWAGWYYVLQRTLAECLIALEIIDRRLRGDGHS